MYGKLITGSPNWNWRIDVECWVDPMVAPAPDVGDYEAPLLAMLQLNNDFINHSKETAPLSYVQNTDNGTVVTQALNPPPVGIQTLVIPDLGPSDWTPVEGGLVLIHSPTSGEGIHTTIIDYDDVLDTVIVDAPVGIPTGWKIKEVVAYFPDCRFVGMTHGDIHPYRGDFRQAVIYSFEGQSAPVMSQNHYVDLS